jgi:hypothetical protein
MKNTNRSLRSNLYLETADTDDLELRVRTPPKRHSQEKLVMSEEYNLLYEFLNRLSLKHEFEKFYKNEVSFYDLGQLTENDLNEMEISAKTAQTIAQGLSDPKKTHRKSSSCSKPIHKNIKSQVAKLYKDFQVLSKKIIDQQLEIIDLYKIK